MKISNETKVGLLAIAAIVLLVIGFNFLKGQKVFSKPYVLFARFTDIGSLEKSNLVKINGLPVGTVFQYGPADKEVNSILVEIHLNKDIRIPDNSIAIIDGSILGSAYINIEKSASATYYKSGDTLKTRIDPSLMSDIKAQIAPTLVRLNETFDSLKITIGALNSVFDPTTKNNLRSFVANMNATSAQLAMLMDARHGALAGSLNNMNAITGNLAANNAAISSSIRNVETATSNLAATDLKGTVETMRATILDLQNSIKNLNSPNGTLGLMMNDRQLYDRLNSTANRLNSTALSAEILLDDIRINPKRYVNISVFGGKNKGGPITSPAPKDTIPK